MGTYGPLLLAPLEYSTVQYITLHYITLHYSTVQYSTVHYRTVHCRTVHCSTVQYSTAIRRQLGALKQLGNKIPLGCRKKLAEGLIISRFPLHHPDLGVYHQQQHKEGSKTTQ